MRAQISPSEWEVLNVLWEKGSPMTAQQVCESLAGTKSWHPKTVGTFLSRLAKKRLLTVRRDGKVNLYVPDRPREQCVQAESATFAQRVFQGALGPMLLQFVEQADLSSAEIRDLERVLRQKKGKR